MPLAFADAKDPALKAEFAQTNAAVIAALEELSRLAEDGSAAPVEWRLPHRRGDVLQRSFEYDEMVDIPLDKLLEIGWADLRKNQAHFKQVAQELEPNKEPRAVLEELGENHPAPDQLLDAFRATFDGLVSFIRTHHIVTIPSDVRPIVEETPPFMRATTSASMDTPGPFETHATEAYFNVTLPDPSMTPAEVEGYMHSFNIGTVISTAVHEAYPGHYMQFLWLPQAPSRVRKLLGREHRRGGLGALHRADDARRGLRPAGRGRKGRARGEVPAPRPVAGCAAAQRALHRRHRDAHRQDELSTRPMAFFQKEGYQSKETAVVETKRGTERPDLSLLHAGQAARS